MPKRLVIHAAFIYTDSQTKQRRRAFRGETINVAGKDLERGTKHGAFGTEADLAPAGLDEGVVDLSEQPPTGTPLVPHVSKTAVLQAALRDRLGVEPGASEADVLAALDTALGKAQAPAETGTAPAPLVEEPSPGIVTVNLPAVESDDDQQDDQRDDDEGEPSDEDGDDEGQADVGDAVQVERPPLSATKKRWEIFAVSQGMPAGEAAAKKKEDLIQLYGGE